MYTLCCALGGFLYFFVKYLVHLCFVGRGGEQKPCYYATGKYWRNIVRATALVGIAFGVKLGLTNVGLDLVSVDYHVLFAATALLWVAVIGFAVLNERPTIHVCVIIVFMTLGQLLLSLQFKKEKQSTILGLVINLMTPALQGVCVVLMRYSALLLFPEWMTKHQSSSSRNNSLRVSNLSCIMLDYHQDFYFHLDTLIAYTTVKLLFSFLASLPMVILVEGGIFSDNSIWNAFTESNFGMLFGDLFIGALITFFLQASLVLLSMLSIAMTMGILSVFKIIPQLAAGIWFSYKTFDSSAMHIAGIVLIVSSSVAYMLHKILSHKTSNPNKEDQGRESDPNVSFIYSTSTALDFWSPIVRDKAIKSWAF